MHEVLEAHCVTCHGEDRTKGDLDLVELLKLKEPDMQAWQKVYNAVATTTMPPAKKDPLTSGDIDTVLSGIKSMATGAVPESRRLLTPAEIKYTLYDLFDIDEEVFDPAVNLKTNYDFDSFHTMQRNKTSAHYLDNLFHAFSETLAKRY